MHSITSNLQSRKWEIPLAVRDVFLIHCFTLIPASTHAYYVMYRHRKWSQLQFQNQGDLTT